MVTIQDFSQAIKFQFTGGSEYGWQCFGPNARWLDSEEPSKYSASIVFDGVNQTVYSAEVSDLINDRSYRWINPEFAQALADEAKLREINNNQAWDDVEFTDLEVAEDFLQKCAAIVNGQLDYDTRISVPLTLSDAEMLDLMTRAHKEDVTFNQYVESILRTVIERESLR